MQRFFRLAMVLAILAPVSCSKTEGPAIARDFPLTRISDRVYVIHGPNEDPGKDNQGFINNPGFVLTNKGVVVVDPGSSVQVGRMLLAKIAGVTPLPVIAVFNTHIHGDHWLGNQAIRDAYPNVVIYAHPTMMAQAPSEGEVWLKRMLTLTANATRGTHLAIPNMGLAHGDKLRLGDVHFRLYHAALAHTDGDLIIEVVEDKVMFLGDIVVTERAGRQDDATFKGNLAAIQMVLQSDAVRFVPGHGKSGGREVPENYQAFLKDLYGAVKKYYALGLSDFDMKDKVRADLARYNKWALFDTGLGKLISLAYLQIETDSF